MKWFTLYNKIGKQPIKNVRNTDITVIIEDRTVKIKGVKFKVDGTPYLIVEPDQEMNHLQSKQNQN